MRPITYTEIVLGHMMQIHPLQPHYWSQLFATAVQLLEPEELAEMEKRIARVEMLVNGEEKYVDLTKEGSPVIRIRPKTGLTLYDIEMAFESNQDYYAFFRREDGVEITKFDVERELERIRKWLYLKVKEKAQNMRFTRPV